jgi:hypothetical protein
MVSGITPCAQECKWIVYFGETPNHRTSIFKCSKRIRRSDALEAEPTKFEAEQPTKPTDCSVIFEPWQQTFPPQTIQGLLLLWVFIEAR